MEELQGTNWETLRGEAEQLSVLAAEAFKRGERQAAQKLYRKAADKALLALYVVPDKAARNKLGDLVQVLCEKMEDPGPEQKSAA